MSDEDIKKSLECCSTKLLSKCLECKITKNGCAEFLASQALALINRQQERIEELEIITGIANCRKYYRKFVDEVFCKQKGNELSEPDFDYIYQLYFEQQAEIEKFKNAIKEADRLFSEGSFYYGLAVVARLAIEIERGGENA